MFERPPAPSVLLETPDSSSSTGLDLNGGICFSRMYLDTCRLLLVFMPREAEREKRVVGKWFIWEGIPGNTGEGLEIRCVRE